MHPNMAISNFSSRCINSEPPVIYSDGQQTRDFIFVKEILAVNRSLFETSAADGELINIKSTGNIAIETLAKEICN